MSDAQLESKAGLGRRCMGCLKYESQTLKIFRCGQCHVTEYCSRECQASHWKSHKKTCNADDSTLSVPEIGRALYENPISNEILQQCFIVAFNMLSASPQHLLSQPFVASIDIVIEPAETADMLKLVIAMREEHNGGPRVPPALFAVCACPHIHKFEALKRSSANEIGIWKAARRRIEKAGKTVEDVPAIALVHLTKAHSTGIPELFPLPIARSTFKLVREEMEKETKNAGAWRQLAEMRSARRILDDCLGLLSNVISADAKLSNSLFGLRTTLSTRDIQVFRDYAAGKDLDPGQPGMHLAAFKRRYYAASLLRERYKPGDQSDAD